jgi:hypothetical protein
MGTPPPKPSETAGPGSRASLAARAAAVAAAAAGVAVRSTRDRVTWLLHKVGGVRVCGEGAERGWRGVGLIVDVSGRVCAACTQQSPGCCAWQVVRRG